MTRITEQQSKKMFKLWNEGDLSKSEVAERFGTSEDVVKYHIRKRQTQSASHVQVLETLKAAAVSETANEELSSGIKRLLKRLLGKGDKGKTIELLVAKLNQLDQLTTRLEQSPATERAEKTTEPIKASVKRGRKYISTADGLLLNNPASYLHRGQRLLADVDTEDILKAVAGGKLIPEGVTPAGVEHELDSTECEHHKKLVLNSFQRYYSIAAPTKAHIDRFIVWYRAVESSALSAEAIREIIIEYTKKMRGGNGLVLSEEEELDRLRQEDRATMHLYDLRRIDWELYKKRAIVEKFCEYMNTSIPLESSENFVRWFKGYDPKIPSDEVRQLMWALVMKNREEDAEIRRIGVEILKERRNRVNQGLSSNSLSVDFQGFPKNHKN